MTVIDAHQHVWNLSRSGYGWLGPEAGVLFRDHRFEELEPSLNACGVEATVLVQSDDDPRDTEAMLEAARAQRRIAGVVGYLPLHEPARVAEQLDAFAAEPLLVGVRNLIHDRPDPDWIVRPAFRESLGLLERAGIPFDLVGVLPRHLEHLIDLAGEHPELVFVLDHLNKPPIGLADREPWWSLIARVAEAPNVRAKISGLYSAGADPSSWTVEQIRPFFDRALELFGPDRCLYGGDWPVALIAGGYQRMWRALQELASPLDADARAALFGGTAAATYRLDPDRLAAAAAATPKEQQ